MTEQPISADIDRAAGVLDAGSVRLFELAGEHPGAHFTAGPLAAALDVPIAHVESGLDVLAQARLVAQVVPGRYRRHDLTSMGPQTVREKGTPALRRMWRRSMIEWYLQRAAAADLAISPWSRRFSPVYEKRDTEPFSNAQAALGWFSVERGNVLKAQCQAAEDGWDGLVFQIAEAAWNPLRVGYFADDIVNTQRLGLLAARQCGHVLEVVFLARLGLGESDRGCYDGAITACATAVDRATAFDVGVLAAALSARGAVYTASGQPRAALADLAQASVLGKEVCDRYDIALWHRRIGQAYAHPGIADFAQAVWHLRTSAELSEALGDAMEFVRAVTYLAEVHQQAHQPDAALFALRLVERAIACCGSPRYQAHAYTVLGRVHAQLGNHDDASNWYATALNLLNNSGPGAANDRTAVLMLQRELGTHEP